MYFTGPKMYVATRDVGERGSTPLHLDATCAVNILVYSSAPQRNTPSALWHLYRPEDSPRIRTYLRERLKSYGRYDQDQDPIHARRTYLTESMRRELQDIGVFAFEIFQKPGDAVFIPAGCSHQVELRLSTLVGYLTHGYPFRSATFTRASRSPATSCVQKGSR